MRKRTRRIALLGSVITAGALCFGATQARASKLVVGTASGDAGTQVTVTVSLVAEGAMVAGTQNDITFDADTPVAAKANKKPDCAVNSALKTPTGEDTTKSATSFAFRPNG